MRKILIIAALVFLIVFAVYLLTGGRETPVVSTTRAERREIRMAVSTNGVIEPVGISEMYAPVDGRIISIFVQEGADIVGGQLLMELESDQIRAALSEANAALLSAMRHEKEVVSGPPREEIVSADAVIAESALLLEEIENDLKIEESLFASGAVARATVDVLRKQRDQLRLRADNQQRQRQELFNRYSSEVVHWEQDRVREIAAQVRFLEQQRMLETVTSPGSGRVYSLEVKPGAYVTRGQLLARINQPGNVRLRAYVDEPDLGRIEKGQSVEIAWDGLPDRRWAGVVERPAEQVVEMNNRTVGYVICSVEGDPEVLIPNLNVRVEITTMSKPDAIVVPRSAVFRPDGIRSVMIFDGMITATKAVISGITTADEIEILEGVREGDAVVINPLDY